MSVVELTITTPDGIHYQAPWYSTVTDASATDTSFILYPAMGVKAAYYTAVAEALLKLGFNCLLMDLRGNGGCSIRPARGVDFGYRELVEIDLPAAVAAVRKQRPSDKIVLLGNSLGGQMSLLHTATHSADIDAVILVACCSVYYGAYRDKAKTWLGTQFMNAVGQLLGYVPGKQLGFAGLEAKTVVSDWAQQARTGRYIATGSQLDYEQALATCTVPVLCYSIDKDPLAPVSAVKHLLLKLKVAPVTYQHLSASDVGLQKVGHFTWAKQPQPFVEKMAQWLVSCNT